MKAEFIGFNKPAIKTKEEAKKLAQDAVKVYASRINNPDMRWVLLKLYNKRTLVTQGIRYTKVKYIMRDNMVIKIVNYVNCFTSIRETRACILASPHLIQCELELATSVMYKLI